MSGILTLVVIGLLMLAIVFFAWLILSVMAGIKASKGEQYAYPMTLRLIK